MRNLVSKFGALFIIFLMVFALQSCAQKSKQETWGSQNGASANAASANATEAVGEGMEADAAANQSIPEVSIDEIKASLTDVYFGYDESVLTPGASSSIARNANALGQIDGLSVILEGHCDERGSSEYNLALGDRRAESVKSSLIANGYPAGSISTISYGKERPQCTAHNDSCWQLNRRVHIEVR